MSAAISKSYFERLRTGLWGTVEDALIPLPKGSRNYRIFHALPSALIVPALLVEGVSVICRTAFFVINYFRAGQVEDPKKDFSAVCRDSRLWQQFGSIETTLGHNQPDFLWGVATCTYQDSGSKNCQASQWTEREKMMPAHNRSGASAHLFELYKTEEGRGQIIERLKQLSVNSYRFSVEWSQIEPTETSFVQDQLQVYVDLCKHLRNAGIQPMVTLHHFSEPKWFYEKGSFEKEENIHYFAKFSERVFRALTEDYQGKPLVEYFCTINEPAIEAFSRYVRGAFLPMKMFQFKKAGEFLLGALKAHQVVYEKLKTIKPEVQIGIVHQRLSFLPANLLLFPIARYLTRLTNEVALGFFKNGVFELKIPFFCHMKETVNRPQTDFVGLQYYGRPVLGLTGSTSFYEPMTLMPMREDPEGLYEAIVETHDAFQVPVIITENGISTIDETQRYKYIRRALYASQKAQEKIGTENLRGYFYWSFCDNFEWNMGMDPQKFGAFGLEKQNENKVLNMNPKTGMSALVKAVNKWREHFQLEKAI